MFAPSVYQLVNSSAAATKPCSTPPGTVDSDPDLALPAPLPPSPPLSPTTASPASSSVDRVHSHLLQLRAGLLPPSQRQEAFALSPGAFADLQARIRTSPALSAWYDTKVRYDYDPPQRSLSGTSGKDGAKAGGRGEYTLRMPSAVHERFIASVEDAVAEGIQALVGRLGRRADRRGEAAARELKKVYKGRSTTIELRAPDLEEESRQDNGEDGKKENEEVVVRRSPDATFFHREAALPALVMEVSYSQSRKDLPRLAESYIVDSRHAIRCVVGLDIPYGPSQAEKKPSRRKNEKDEEATVSVWRPGVEKDEDGEEVGVCVQHVANAPFQRQRDDGNRALELSLEDLLPAHVFASLPPLGPEGESDQVAAENVTIPFSDLRTFLAAAAGPGSNTSSATPAEAVPRSGAPTKFRKRKRSPSEEELSDGREKAYARLEAAEMHREVEVDGEWCAGVIRKASGRRRSAATDGRAEPQIADVRQEDRTEEKAEAGVVMEEMPERRRSLRKKADVRYGLG